MSEYVQCPNCGGYKICAEDIKETKVVKEKFKSSVVAWLFLSFTCAGITYIGTTGFLAFIFQIFFPSKQLSVLAILVLLSILCIAGLIPVFFSWSAWKSFQKREKSGEIVSKSKTVTIGYNYTCNICGNHWTWNIGTPLPKVTVRPDLIAKVESQRWTCAHCGSSNDGTRTSCYVCTYPKLY